MIMEDCERKYKEAFNMAVLEHKSDNEAVRESIERIFPQLKESKGEKIRKALINFFDGWGEKTWDSGIKYSEVVAWLQKQGKHANFRNKIQIGDKVTRNDNGELVNLSQLERVAKKLEKQGEQKPFAWSKEDKGVLLESISVLQSSSHWVLADKLKSLKERVGYEENCTTTSEPVVKGNKGNYGEISPNSAWSEEDEKIVGNIRSIIEKYAFSQSAVDVNGELCEKEYIEADSWLKSLKDRVGCEANRTTKKAWSEEDEERLSDAIFFVREYQIPTRDKRLLNAAKETEDWLKSLKEKFVDFDKGFNVGFSAAKYNQWKPSDEQMQLLKEACDQHWEPDGLDPLYTLYQDLKKLRE